MGVSGGPDSLCLLHLLLRLAPEYDLHLHVAHLNHGLRAGESDNDAEFVARTALEWGLLCSLGRADVRALASIENLSMEEAARQARYRFLAETAAREDACTIAVGHTADDQSETVLMHFLRGSGVGGLRGMLPCTPLTDYRVVLPCPPTGGDAEPVAVGSSGFGARSPLGKIGDLRLIRPLLAVRRAETEAYCLRHDLRPRFDRSNEDTTFFRNRLRHELLPELERYNPAIRELLLRTAEVMAGDHEVLSAALELAWERVVLPCPPGEIQFDLAGWRALPIGLQRATVREGVRRLRQNLRNVNWAQIERAVCLGREGRTGQAATLVAGLSLSLAHHYLRIAAEGAPLMPAVPQIAGTMALRAPGTTVIGGGWSVIVRRLGPDELPEGLARHADPEPRPPPARAVSPPTGKGAQPGRALGWVAWLDADAAGPSLLLRPREVGDRFFPHGLEGHSASLHEFMINAKVPREVRGGWPILVGRSGIAWVCGLRLDERAIVRSSTRSVWQVSFVREHTTSPREG